MRSSVQVLWAVVLVAGSVAPCRAQESGTALDAVITELRNGLETMRGRLSDVEELCEPDQQTLNQLVQRIRDRIGNTDDPTLIEDVLTYVGRREDSEGTCRAAALGTVEDRADLDRAVAAVAAAVDELGGQRDLIEAAISALRAGILDGAVVLAVERSSPLTTTVLLVPIESPGFVGIGTLTVQYPSTLTAGVQSDRAVRAVLTPVSIFGSPESDSAVGWAGTDRVLDTITLTNPSVSIVGATPENVPLNFQTPITWSWSLQTTREFTGADFALRFNTSYSGVEVPIAEASVEIGVQPPVPWWDFGQNLFIVVAALVIGGLLATGTDAAKRLRLKFALVGLGALLLWLKLAA